MNYKNVVLIYSYWFFSIQPRVMKTSVNYRLLVEYSKCAELNNLLLLGNENAIKE